MPQINPPTSEHVNFTVAEATTFSDAVQFVDRNGNVDTTWDLTNKTFRMGLKGNYEQSPEVLAFTSEASEIIVLDPTLRVLGFNVPHTVLGAALVPGVYFYDLRMTDTDTAVRTQMLHGEFRYAQAVTEG